MKDRRNKGRISGPFVPMLKATMNEPAWLTLTHGARSLYCALKSRHNSRLGNAVYLSTRAAALELGSHSHRDHVRRWFRELEYYGFIVMVSPAHHGVNGHGKAPHWRLTEEWYLGQPPTRDYQRWNGTVFNEQKSPKHYQKKNRSRGPDGWSTLAQTGGPVPDQTGGPLPRQSGPDGWSIQPDKPGPDGRSITSSTTPMLEKRSGEQDSKAPVSASADLQIPDDLSIPWFMRR